MKGGLAAAALGATILVLQDQKKELWVPLVLAMLNALKTGWRSSIVWLLVSMAIVAIVVLYN